MIIITIIIFLAGVATAYSQSLYNILPPLFSLQLQSIKRPFGVVIGLIAGFSFFTFLLSWLIEQLGATPSSLRYASILFIGVCGFVLIMPYLGDLFAKWTSKVADIGISLQMRNIASQDGFFSGLFLGALLGLFWTVPVGLFLAGVSILTAAHHIEIHIIQLALAYSLGAGITLLSIAFSQDAMSGRVPLLTQMMGKIKVFVGWLLLLIAVAVGFNLDIDLEKWINEVLPEAKVDNSPEVRQQVKKVTPPPINLPNYEVVPEVGTGQEVPDKIAPPPKQ